MVTYSAPNGLSRRMALALLSSAAALAASPAAAQAGLRLGDPRPFSFDDLKRRARSMAGEAFVPPPPPSKSLQALDYDALGRLRYRPEAALWRGEAGPGAIEFFHLGRYVRTPVTLHAVDRGAARQILYSEALFQAPPGHPAPRGATGFAGFRVMNPGDAGDWVAYSGASYFRSADPFNQYGLSARGLAIDTAASKPEEFPAFTDLWLERDAQGDLVVSALLDGPSVAGAYRITHHRGPTGLTQEVEAELTFRAAVEQVGIAPLTSMFWYGQADPTHAVDWRPQIHDSDGLAIWTGAGERIWRPLADPARLSANAFVDKGLRGFGLMQRDRRFDDYQDDGVFYDRRPSAWVEPVGDWGAGSVVLVEIPTASETDDNIVAFWTPAGAIAAGQTLSLNYRLHWCDEEPTPVGVGRVVATRAGVGGRPGQATPVGQRKFVIDFEGGRLGDLDRQSGVEPVVRLSSGAAIAPAAYPVVGTKRWRLMFDYAAGERPIDMRAFLRLAGEALTETWIYQAPAA